MWEKDNILDSHLNIRNTRATLWRRTTKPRTHTRIHVHAPVRLNAAWQTLSPIGLRDRLSTLRSSWVATPSVGERVSRRCPLACRARDKHNGVNWQLSMKSLDSSRWFYAIAHGTVTCAQSSQSTVVSCIESNRMSCRNIERRQREPLCEILWIRIFKLPPLNQLPRFWLLWKINFLLSRVSDSKMHQAAFWTAVWTLGI